MLDVDVVLTGEAVGSVVVLEVVEDGVLEFCELLVVDGGAIKTMLGDDVWTTNVAVIVP